MSQNWWLIELHANNIVKWRIWQGYDVKTFAFEPADISVISAGELTSGGIETIVDGSDIFGKKPNGEIWFISALAAAPLATAAAMTKFLWLRFEAKCL